MPASYPSCPLGHQALLIHLQTPRVGPALVSWVRAQTGPVATHPAPEYKRTCRRFKCPICGPLLQPSLDTRPAARQPARLPLGPPSTQGVHWARPGVMRQPGLRRLGVPWGAVVSTRASRRRKLALAERVVHRGVKANSVWLLEGNEENLPAKLP